MAVPARTLGAMRLRARASAVARAVQVPVQEFIHTQGVSSAFLLIAAIAALIWANSPWRASYYHLALVNLSVSGLRLPIDEWINEAMMAVFFFLMGMEIKKEIVHGELSDIRRASLPVFAALGGMITPALIYAAFNHGLTSAHGWGIPMATDIAFSLGVLAMVKGVPQELKVFLLTLAIADDIGAIVVIAVFYTSALHWNYLLLAVLLVALVLLCRKVGVGQPIIYTLLGIGVWIAVLRSGVHPTIAGVVLGLLMSAASPLSLSQFGRLGSETMEDLRDAERAGDTARTERALGAMEYLLLHTESPIDRLTRRLNPWVAFVVLPLFALANAGVTFSAATARPLLNSAVTWGIVVGLVVGKPVGIISASWITSRLGISRLPQNTGWAQFAAVSVLAGIGFTVSLFIGGLSFANPAQSDSARVAVLAASLIAGGSGYILLRRAGPQPPSKG